MRVSIPIEPDADEARRWLENELSKPEYREQGQSLLDRLRDWINDLLNRISFSSSGDGAFLNPGAIVAIVIGLAVVGLLVWLFRGQKMRAKARAASASVFEDDVRTSVDMDAAARRAAEAGDWTLAVLERFRAMVRRLEERGVVDVVPGMTAWEFTVAAGAMLPAHAHGLTQAGDVFDAVRYGHAVATRDLYDAVTSVNDAVVDAPATRLVSA